MADQNPEYARPQLDEKSGRLGSVLGGLVLGSVAGAVTALLLAPRSGRDTRTQLMEKGLELRNRAASGLDNAVGRVQTKASRLKAGGRHMAEELKEQGQDLLADQLDRVAAVAQAGKKAIKGS